MADLNQAADQLDGDIDALKTAVDETMTDGEALNTVIAEAQEAITAEWEELQQRANTFVEAVEAEKSSIEEAVADVVSQLEAFGTEADEVKESVTGFLEEAKSELENLQQSAADLEPTLEEVLSKLEGVEQALAERAQGIQDELKSHVSDMGEFLATNTAEFLADLRSQADTNVESLKTYFTGELVPSMNSKVDDYLSNLSDIGGQLENRITDASTSFEEAATNAMQQMFSGFTDLIENAQNVANQIDQALETLKGFIDTGGEAVATGKEVVTTGVETTNVGLMSAIGLLEELKEFFSRFSFVSM